MTIEADIAKALAAPDSRVLLQGLSTERAANLATITALNAQIAELKARLFVPDIANRIFFATFPTLGTMRDDPGDGAAKDGVWWVEQKVPGRATIIAGGRDGPTAVRLHTEPGDSGVSGSLGSERNDLSLNTPSINGYEGETCFWANSILFPDDFVNPQVGAWSAVFGFHDSRNLGGQGNYTLFVDQDGNMKVQGHAGPTVIGDNNDWAGNQYSYTAPAGKITRNKWYDFVYNVKWASDAGGFIKIWCNGAKILDHVGPTIYKGYGVYLKLANYHSPYTVPCSVVHDRVIKGKTLNSVAIGPLE